MTLFSNLFFINYHELVLDLTRRLFDDRMMSINIKGEIE